VIPPPHGLCVPAAWHRVIRADQLELVLDRRRRIRVDLLGCRAPSPATEPGREAKHWMEAWLEESAELPMCVWIPLGDNLLLAAAGSQLITARAFVGTTDLSVLLVARGLAEPTNE
jgi:endonuclease YncB( thermonuclease family)